MRAQTVENRQNKSVDTLYSDGSQCCAMAKKQIPEKLAMRPTADDYAILTKLRSKLGVDSSQIIRLALRKLAEAEGLRAS